MKSAAIAVLLLAAAPAAAQQPKSYTSEKWGFSARFPYPIKETPGASGGATISSANAGDTIAYMLSVFPIDDAVLKTKTGDKILEDAVRGAVENVKGSLLSKTDITLGPFTGKQFDIKSAQFVARCRIYLVGKRMYLPMVIAAPELKLPLEPAVFHESFRLTEVGKR